MELIEYCKNKKIDPIAFKKHEPEKWEEFSMIFSNVSAASFTQQKKFLINDLRRKYPLAIQEDISQDMTINEKSPAKPVIKIAPKIKKPQ